MWVVWVVVGVLGFVSSGAVLAMLAALYYGVGPVQAVDMLRADVDVVIVLLGWSFLGFGFARWLRYVVLKFNGKATPQDEFSFVNVLAIAGMGAFVMGMSRFVSHILVST